MIITPEVKKVLLTLAKEKKIYLEGNILKVLKAEKDDKELVDYLKTCKDRDVTSRKKRLQVTKQVQSQNKDLESAAKENIRVNKQLETALKEAIDSAEIATKSKEESEKSREEADRLRYKAEQAKELAETDLSLLQKKTQTELMSNIVKVALWVIMGVGVITTALYVFVLLKGHDSKIIESTWSNLFGILLTNSFSIIGTIMGVKHATSGDKK
jgi:flagellar biosynthesis regulator FlaF